MVHVGAILSLISRFLPERLEVFYQRNMRHRDFPRIFEYMDTHPPVQVTVAELAELCQRGTVCGRARGVHSSGWSR